MKSLFIILLAGYAVRSDENNYYVIEMQEAPPTPKTPIPAKKPFNVYWNVPTMQCASKKIYFENLYENFGIIQNSHDRFKGENITILYDPGLFPALFKNESGGKFRFRNGGVPQEGNLSKHLEEFKMELDRSIPDKKFNGVAVIDFESWRPQFRQNFGELQPYKDLSIDIERKLHWWWKEAWIKEEAKRRFEEAARTFMQSTLTVAKKLRPLARWGFYGFPYCFNMASNHLVERCADGVPKENDEISWLWQESTGLYPSVYSSVQLSTSQLVSLIRGRMREAARCAGGYPDVLLPYFWYRYRDAGYLTEIDLSSALSMLHKSAATGFIIWGSSNDVNTVEKCNNLKTYVQNVLGPAIAKYTKSIMRDSDEYEDITTLSAATDTKSPTPNLDPELHWMPPDNYTQNLKNEVVDQIHSKFGLKVTNGDKFTVLQNNSVLIDLILNAVLNSVNNATTTTDVPKNKYDMKIQLQKEFVVSNTELNIRKSTDTSQVTNSIVTNNPLLNTTNDTTTTKVESQSVEKDNSETPIFTKTTTSEDDMFESEETDGIDTDLEIETETVDFVNNTRTGTDQTTDNDYDVTLDDDDDDDDDFYNSEAFISFFNKKTTVTEDGQALNADTINTDTTNIDTTNTDTNNTDITNTDATNTDTTNTDATNTDTTNTDTTNTDTTNTDTTNTDTTNTDTTNTDITNTDTTNTDTTNTDTTYNDTTNTDTTNTDATNTDTTNTDTTNTDTTNTDTTNTDTTYNDTTNTDTTYTDTSNTDTINTDTINTDTTYTDKTNIQTTNTDTTNSDATNTNSINTNISKDDKKGHNIFTLGLLESKDIDSGTDILTTDKSDILEVQSTEFLDIEFITGNDTYEDTNENDYTTESNTPSYAKPTTEENVFFDSSTNNEQKSTRKSNEYQYNSSILTATPTNFKLPLNTNLPSEIRNKEFGTKDTEMSKITESKATERINTSMTPNTSKSTFEDTEESTSIVPSTDQVIY